MAKRKKSYTTEAVAPTEGDVSVEQSEKSYESIARQVQSEYDVSWNFMKPKLDEWLLRLKLYNNQRRDKEAVGDPHIFTIHQTVLASLYDDKLSVNFGAREEGDDEKMENLNSLARFDYHEMEKDILDYEWAWDASFFGRGLVLLNDFDIQSKTPIPEVLDPTTFLRDPRARSVNGDRFGRGAARFFGYEVGMTKRDLKKNPEYFNLGKLRRDSSDSINSLMANARRQRRDAQGLADIFNIDSELSENYEFTITRWFTFVNGKPCVVELGNERETVIRHTYLPWNKWPVIDRPLYPIAHDWDGVSIPDITEDKQRFRAVLQNLSADLVKADLNGQYLFDENRFRKNQDFSFRFGKWIPVRGNGSLSDAAQPLNTKQVSNSVRFILDLLDVASQKATATPEIQQGALSGEKRTLGEIELVASKVDTRYSLAAKIFGWSERRFWQQWYNVYDEYYGEGLGKKMMRIEGAFGNKWNGISRKDIITNNKLGPDIEIESKILSEARKARNFQQMLAIAPMVQADPEADKTYYKRKVAGLLLSKDEVERLYPYSPDEMIAREENDMLNDGEIVVPDINDDHVAHLRIHAGAKDTEELKKHIEAHRFFVMQKRQFPQLFPQVPTDMSMGQPEQGGVSAQPAPEGAMGNV